MPRVSVSKSGIRSVDRNASLQRYAQRFRELCLRPPTKRHGPYFELTYKANGKTVNVKLSPQAAPLYKAAAQQYRKLKTLLNRLDKLSKNILRHQANWQSPSAKIDAKTGVIPISPV